MKIVGPEQYKRLIEAMAFYEKWGFKALDVPWAVSKEALDITRPPQAGPETLMYHAGGMELCPVASAEQSFLQMQIDSGRTMKGSYVAITPCFRNEWVLDALHQPYFMKVELISWDRTEQKDLDNMLSIAGEFFEKFVETDEIENHDPDPLARVQAIDIVTKESGIELGSYGIREHPKVGRWLYGTGCAEPRLSYGINVEAGLTKEIQAYF